MRQKLRQEIYRYLEMYLDEKFQKWVESLQHKEMWQKIHKNQDEVIRMKPMVEEALMIAKSMWAHPTFKSFRGK